MMFWIFLVIALSLTACFMLQSLVAYSVSEIRRRKAARPSVRQGVLLPELIALEAQFFLAPKRAIAEARTLLVEAGAPADCLAKVSDQASFSLALQQLQGHFAVKSPAVAKAGRPLPLK
jgi:hypothetical protein